MRGGRVGRGQIVRVKRQNGSGWGQCKIEHDELLGIGSGCLIIPMQKCLANNPLPPVTLFPERCCITAAHKAGFCLPLGDIRFGMPVLALSELVDGLHAARFW
jgi:hypothetical protein